MASVAPEPGEPTCATVAAMPAIAGSHADIGPAGDDDRRQRSLKYDTNTRSALKHCFNQAKGRWHTAQSAELSVVSEQLHNLFAVIGLPVPAPIAF